MTSRPIDIGGARRMASIQPAACNVCQRKPKYGCSHIDCPHRRQLTADHETRTADDDSLDGCYHTRPTNKE